MKKIEVKTAGGGYEVLIGPGILSRAADNLKKLGFSGRAVIVTNPVVGELYGRSLRDSLAEAGYSPAVLEVPDGEENKSLEQAARLYTELCGLQADRRTPVLALGGGVIGDLAGFVAATYMRGIPLVHLPTTLLAQVDSSIGGKTAVDHGRLKNMIGSFYQPVLVMADISTLGTLPENEFTGGMAEVIKYGIIRDAGLFQMIENSGKSGRAEESFREEIVFRCASIKASVVEMDEKDTGLRNILNYGHTAGHAIEAAGNFRLGHGPAVAAGMAAAAAVAERLGGSSGAVCNRIKSVIQKNGLPVTLTGMDVQQIMLALQHDKKNLGGRVRMILAREIGEVFISEVDPGLIRQVIEEMNE